MERRMDMDPQQAWQIVIDNLQMDMSRSTFSIRIKPLQLTKVVDDVFYVDCQTEENQDWLTSRMKSPFERMLNGVLNRSVKIEFLAQDLQIYHKEPELSHLADPFPNQDVFDLEILQASVRDIFLEPNRVIRFPVYLFRWLPYVHPQTIFVVIALWQEYYLASGNKSNSSNPRVSIRAEQVCRWAGISRAQFFRLFQPGSHLEWFVRKTETAHELNPMNGRMKKSANKYILLSSCLTPGDREDLKSYLMAHRIHETPIDTLENALQENPKQIFQYPFRMPPDQFHHMLPNYQTPQDVIRDLIGKHHSPEVISLLDQLAAHLVSSGDFVLVSWYFLRHWLPILGSEAAMFVLVLRNLCYFNDETGEIRDEVWLDGGYQGIANRLGITNPRLVANWLPAKIERPRRRSIRTIRTEQELGRRQSFQELIGLFVKRIDYRMNSTGSYAWKFKVQRFDPLTPQHQKIEKAVLCLLAASLEKGLVEELSGWMYRAAKDWTDTLKSQSRVDLRLSIFTEGCSETLSNLLNDCLATLKFADKDCFETLLKILKSSKDSLIFKDTQVGKN